jgi:hypothetical protein
MQMEEHDQALRKFWFEFGSRRNGTAFAVKNPPVAPRLAMCILEIYE